MEIQVELFLHFRTCSPAGPTGAPFPLNLPDRATTQEVLERLGIPDQAEKIVLVDGNVQPLGTPLEPGQTVTVFPPLNGG